MPTKNDQKKYSNAFTSFAMSGWGLSDNQPKDHQPLLVASVKYFSPATCHIDYTTTSLCAVGINGEPGFCSGNDGGTSKMFLYYLGFWHVKVPRYLDHVPDLFQVPTKFLIVLQDP